MKKDGEKEIWYNNLLGLWALYPRPAGSHSIFTYCPAYLEEISEVSHKSIQRITELVLTLNFIESKFTWRQALSILVGHYLDYIEWRSVPAVDRVMPWARSWSYKMETESGELENRFHVGKVKLIWTRSLKFHLPPIHANKCMKDSL